MMCNWMRLSPRSCSSLKMRRKFRAKLRRQFPFRWANEHAERMPVSLDRLRLECAAVERVWPGFARGDTRGVLEPYEHPCTGDFARCPLRGLSAARDQLEGK